MHLISDFFMLMKNNMFKMCKKISILAHEAQRNTDYENDDNSRD